jgi:hypothetical protein
MSSIKHPVGPQSSKVYWRRRVVVGLGLLFVLVIIFLIIVRPGAGASQPDGAAKVAGSTAASTDAPGGTVPDAAAGPTKCDPAQVQVEATTDAVTYEPGLRPQLSLSITNTGSTPCIINAGTAQQVFTISSGQDVYWKSTDCQTERSDADVTLKPNVPVSSTTPIIWDRIRSSPDTCGSSTRPAAPAGGSSYHLAVAVDGIEAPTPKQFILY